ncbi:hypothetical protein N665_2675s0005 [Sinapis alba]|nr:hypothetical protein N665_2675s0005 [Sinapis alba]
MKRNLWLVALFLVLYMVVISSYASLTRPYQIRKLVPIEVSPSNSGSADQCC